MRRTTALLATLLSLGACGPEETGGREGGAEPDRMGPSMTMGMMEDMPEGIPASLLPESESGGARLVARYCVRCHGIPSPRRLSAAEWPSTLDRMVARMEHMEEMGGMMEGMSMMGSLEAPSAEERESMLEYLQAHAFRATSAEALPNGPEAALFARTCSRCHALPDPVQYPPEEWPGLVARMRANMRRMDVEGITDEQARAITRYLQRSAASTDGAAGRGR